MNDARPLLSCRSPLQAHYETVAAAQNAVDKAKRKL